MDSPYYIIEDEEGYNKWLEGERKMSELTTCNYCNKKRLQKTYGKKLIQVGNDFYVEDKDGEKVIRGKKVRFVSWMMEIPDHCVC